MHKGYSLSNFEQHHGPPPLIFGKHPLPSPGIFNPCASDVFKEETQRTKEVFLLLNWSKPKSKQMRFSFVESVPSNNEAFTDISLRMEGRQQQHLQ